MSWSHSLHSITDLAAARLLSGPSVHCACFTDNHFLRSLCSPTLSKHRALSDIIAHLKPTCFLFLDHSSSQKYLVLPFTLGTLAAEYRSRPETTCFVPLSSSPSVSS